MYSALNALSEYLHVKKHSYSFLLVFKILESLQGILNYVRFLYALDSSLFKKGILLPRMCFFFLVPFDQVYSSKFGNVFQEFYR